MSRKNKKKRWWERDREETPIDQDLFSNTIKQHQKKMEKEGRAGFHYDYSAYDEENDLIESPFSFEWGLERKVMDDPSEQSGKSRYESAQKNFSAYNTSGAWRGYEFYKKPELSYKYVQQMANALAAQYKITVRVGSSWSVDLKNKTLTYNPASLIYGTKSELLATLMHEIGKLRYGTHPDELQDKYLAVYGTPAVETLSVFEDVRVDYWMLKAYEGATEIYESAIPAVDKRVKEYRETSVKFRKIVSDIIIEMYNNIEASSRHSSQSQSEYDVKLAENLRKIFGESDPNVVKQKITEIQQMYLNSGSIYDYCAEMLRVMYDSDSPETGFSNIKEKVVATEQQIQPAKKMDSTQKTVTHLTQNVYPVVEDLLRDFNRDNQKIKDMFPNIAVEVTKHIEDMIHQNVQHLGKNGQGRVNTDPSGNSIVRSSGPTEDVIPPEWQEGEYAPLRESVLPDIKALIKKLTFIRREDMAKKFESEQRRGKLNSKKLYKSATGSRRVFKRLMPNTNIVQSFAFSVLIDISGSMAGANITHTTRALIIFAEVFKKMDIPFEVITFASGAKTLKKFDDDVDKLTEKRIGGLVKCASGGTNLDQGLKIMKLEQQPQKNKVCVVLTDGGVGDIRSFDRNYFEPMQKKGIVSLAFGINCERELANMCMGNSKVLDNPGELPAEFTALVKRLIKRK